MDMRDNASARPSKALAGSFHERAVAVIKRIPEGKVATYGQIAALAHQPRAARQVARILHSSWSTEQLPWYRIVNRRGRISLKPGSGYEIQKTLLENEGVAFSGDDSIDFDRYLWCPA